MPINYFAGTDRINGPYGSWVVPARAMDSATARSQREGIANALIEISTSNAGFARNAAELTIREATPKTDLGLANEYWLTGALTAGTKSTGYVNKALPNNQALAFFALADGPVPPAVEPGISVVYFGVGASGATPIAQFEVEHLWGELEFVAYFSEAVYYKPLQTVYVSLMPRLSPASERVVLQNLICEPKGLTINAV